MFCVSNTCTTSLLFLSETNEVILELQDKMFLNISHFIFTGSTPQTSLNKYLTISHQCVCNNRYYK